MVASCYQPIILVVVVVIVVVVVGGGLRGAWHEASQ